MFWLLQCACIYITGNHKRNDLKLDVEFIPAEHADEMVYDAFEIQTLFNDDQSEILNIPVEEGINGKSFCGIEPYKSIDLKIGGETVIGIICINHDAVSSYISYNEICNLSEKEISTTLKDVDYIFLIKMML